MPLELERCGVSPQAGVLVALSGGADSVALLHMAREAVSQGRLCFVAAAHLNHGLRGREAERDAAYCADLCREWEIPLYLKETDIRAVAGKEKLSLETAGRKARYEFLHDTLEKCGADYIATAHHADDQAETVLMHLIRGSGTDGIAGIRYRNGKLIRPLLGYRHRELCAYLEERGILWCEDSTNAVSDVRRNQIRLNLLPELEAINPGIVQSLSRTAAYAAADADYLTSAAERALDEAAKDGGWCRSLLMKWEEPIRRRCIKLILEKNGIPGGVEHTDIERVESLLFKQSGTLVPLGPRLTAFADGPLLRVGYQEQQQFSISFERLGTTVLPQGCFMARETAFRIPENALEAYVDMDCIPEDAVVRTAKRGDWFRPLGAPGRKKLSDVMTDRKIPPSKRFLPLLCSGNEVLWVPGYTVSERIRVTPCTGRVLNIRYER